MKNRLTPKVILPLVKENFGKYEITKKKNKGMKERMEREEYMEHLSSQMTSLMAGEMLLKILSCFLFVHPLLVLLQSFMSSKHGTKKDIDRRGGRSYG